MQTDAKNKIKFIISGIFAGFKTPGKHYQASIMFFLVFIRLAFLKYRFTSLISL